MKNSILDVWQGAEYASDINTTRQIQYFQIQYLQSFQREDQNVVEENRKETDLMKEMPEHE